MNVLYIERSTGECRNGEWVKRLRLDPPPDRIVVGIGPGSFAGIRSALAFAKGYAVGRDCEVTGLPSACALVGPEDLDRPLAVVGDARQGKFWVALFDGYSPVCDVFLVDRRVIHVLGGILGILIMAALAITGSVELLTPMHILLYQLIWAVPGLLVTFLARTV